MRILIILKYIPSETKDRKADAIISTIKAHEAAGYDVVVLTTGREEKHNWQRIDFRPTLMQKALISIIYKISRSNAKKYRHKLILKSVAKYHGSKRIDATFAYCTSETPAIIAALLKESIGIPYIIREHRNYERTKKSINDVNIDFRKAVKKANCVLAVSPQLAKIMKNYGLKEEIGVLPNAISNKFFIPPNIQGQFRKWAGNNFLYAGWTRWRDLKRLDLLIKAFSLVLKERQDVKLAVVGKIETEEQQNVISEIIQKNNIEPFIMFYGEASRIEIHQIAHACNCCVFPSDYETFGLPVLEAIAAGKPVVATRCGGPESIITNGSLGYIVERGDCNLLAQAMIDVYDNINTFDSNYIQSVANKNYSESSVASQWKNVYKKLFAI